MSHGEWAILVLLFLAFVQMRRIHVTVLEVRERQHANAWSDDEPEFEGSVRDEPFR